MAFKIYECSIMQKVQLPHISPTRVHPSEDMSFDLCMINGCWHTGHVLILERSDIQLRGTNMETSMMSSAMMVCKWFKDVHVDSRINGLLDPVNWGRLSTIVHIVVGLNERERKKLMYMTSYLAFWSSRTIPSSRTMCTDNLVTYLKLES